MNTRISLKTIPGDMVGSGGPRNLWKIYSGFKKSTKAEVSIFVFEKKSVDSLSKTGVPISFWINHHPITHPMNQSINHPNNESSDVSINQSITQFILPRLYPDREVAIEFFRSGVSRLTRLRHPRLLTVQHPLEESRDSLAFCTEPVFASLANILEARSNAEKQRHPALKGSFSRYRRKRRKLFFMICIFFV